MPKIFKQEELEYNELQSDLKPNAWFSSQKLSELGKSKDLFFKYAKIKPWNVFISISFSSQCRRSTFILDGSATLRTPSGLEFVYKGDILFFETGETSTHQLFNHTTEPCIYFDFKTNNGFDFAEFPDTNKVVFGPAMEIIEKGKEVDYFQGNENIDETWAKIKRGN